MKIGVPAEVKNHEYRVAATPAGVHELVRHGHDVHVQRGAGLGSHIPDEEYLAAGAKIVETADEVWAESEMVLKVKEPIAEEYHRLREGQVLFTYLHLAASRPCTDALPGEPHHRHRLRDGPGRRLAAAAGPDVRGGRAARAAGGGLQPRCASTAAGVFFPVACPAWPPRRSSSSAAASRVCTPRRSRSAWAPR